MKKKKIILLFCISIFIISSCYYLFLNKKVVLIKRTPPKVYVSLVKSGEFLEKVTSIGTLSSNEDILVRANIKEFIEKIYFESGQFVNKGDLLVSLRHEEEQALLDQAKIDLEEQERELKRITSLTEKEAIAQNRYNEQLFKYNNSKANLNSIKAKYNDYFIYAPFSGVVGISKVSVGSLVDSSITITTLDDIQTFSLNFTVPEIYIGSIKPGLEIFARNDAFKDKVFKGKIKVIDIRVDPYSHAFNVKAGIENIDGLLHPGMLMSIDLILNQKTAIMIPEIAVISKNSNNYVVTVDDKGKTYKRKVIIGKRDNKGMLEVLSNLKENELVIVDGISTGFSSGFVTPVFLEKEVKSEKAE